MDVGRKSAIDHPGSSLMCDWKNTCKYLGQDGLSLGANQRPSTWESNALPDELRPWNKYVSVHELCRISCLLCPSEHIVSEKTTVFTFCVLSTAVLPVITMDNLKFSVLIAVVMLNYLKRHQNLNELIGVIFNMFVSLAKNHREMSFQHYFLSTFLQFFKSVLVSLSAFQQQPIKWGNQK